MRTEKKHITPQVAKDMLAKNTKNRPLMAKVVEEYSGAMRRGEWEANGEAIKFGVDGDLLDGQHRLAAVIKSGVSIDSLVVRGLNGQAWMTFDKGHPRKLSHELSRNGEAYANDLATAIRYFRVFNSAEPQNLNKVKLTTKQGLAILDQHPVLRDCVAEMISWGARRIGSAGMFAGAYAATYESSGDWAVEFWEAVGGGVGLERGTPQYLLRNRLLESKQAMPHERLNRATILALVIKSWNCYIEGTVMESCRISRTDLEATLKAAK